MAAKKTRASPALRVARATRDELTRQLILERRFSLVAADGERVSPHAAAVVVESGERMLEKRRPEPGLVTVYGPTYIAPADAPLDVTGLAFLDDTRLLVGLSGGHGNIFAMDNDVAMKLDDPPGAESSRWISIREGGIMIAG